MGLRLFGGFLRMVGSKGVTIRPIPDGNAMAPPQLPADTPIADVLHPVIVDPFKAFRHNLDVLNQLTLFQGLGVPLLVGLSRKGFVGALTGEKAAGQRVHGSVGGAIHAALNGAHILRVHDVKATVAALAVALAAADPGSSGL